MLNLKMLNLHSLNKSGRSKTKVGGILSGPVEKEHSLSLRCAASSDLVNERYAEWIVAFSTSYLQLYSICDKELDKLDHLSI